MVTVSPFGITLCYAMEKKPINYMRLMRVRKNLTQAELASLVRVSRPCITRLENDDLAAAGKTIKHRVEIILDLKDGTLFPDLPQPEKAPAPAEVQEA